MAKLQDHSDQSAVQQALYRLRVALDLAEFEMVVDEILHREFHQLSALEDEPNGRS